MLMHMCAMLAFIFINIKQNILKMSLYIFFCSNDPFFILHFNDLPFVRDKHLWDEQHKWVCMLLANGGSFQRDVNKLSNGRNTLGIYMSDHNRGKISTKLPNFYVLLSSTYFVFCKTPCLWYVLNFWHLLEQMCFSAARSLCHTSNNSPSKIHGQQCGLLCPFMRTGTNESLLWNKELTSNRGRYSVL